MDAHETDPTQGRDTVDQLEDQELRNPITDDEATLVTPGEGFGTATETDLDDEGDGPPNSPKAFPPM